MRSGRQKTAMLGTTAPLKRINRFLLYVTLRDITLLRPLLVMPAKNTPTPTNPALWSQVKSQAKQKFDVYPSAYANAWAAKQYKAKGGKWSGGNNKVK